MLLALGAVPEPVTRRQETPLYLATRSNCRNMNFRPIHEESASLDTVRVLVEQGKNDPMQCDDIGWTSILTASRNRSGAPLLWLVHQAEYELDLNYETPSGITTASLFAQRDDLSPALFEPLLYRGIAIEAPCAIWWCPQFGSHLLRIPGMVQFNTKNNNPLT